MTYESWPVHDEALVTDPEVEIAIQIKGKTRAKIIVPSDATEEQIREAALAHEKIKSALVGQTVRKVIVVPGRLVNIVAT